MQLYQISLSNQISLQVQIAVAATSSQDISWWLLLNNFLEKRIPPENLFTKSSLFLILCPPRLKPPLPSSSVPILLKLQTLACDFTKIELLHWYFSKILIVQSALLICRIAVLKNINFCRTPSSIAASVLSLNYND